MKRAKIQSSAVVTNNNVPLSVFDTVVSSSEGFVDQDTTYTGTGAVTINGSNEINLKTIGNNTTYGPTVSNNNTNTVTVPNISVDSYGRVTGGGTVDFIIPTTGGGNSYSIIGGTGITITGTDNKTIGLATTLTGGSAGPESTLQTSVGNTISVKVPRITVDNTGRVTSLTDKEIKITDTSGSSGPSYTQGTGIKINNNTISLQDTLTGGTYGPTVDVTTSSTEQTIKIPQITVDNTGRVTGVTERNLKVKDTNTDTNTTYTGSDPISVNSSNNTISLSKVPISLGGTGQTSLSNVTVGGANNAASVSGHTVAIDIPDTARLTDAWRETPVSLPSDTDFDTIPSGHYYIPTLAKTTVTGDDTLVSAAQETLEASLHYPSVTGGQPIAANDRIICIGNNNIKFQIWYSKTRSNYRYSHVFFRNYSTSGWTSWSPLMTASQDLMKVFRYNSGTVDLQSCTTQGSYWINSGGTVSNAPSNYSNSYSSILVVFGNVNNVTGAYAQGIAQLLLSPSNASHPAWVRYKYSTTWGNWNEIGGAVDLGLSLSTVSGGSKITLQQNGTDVSSPVTLVGGTNITVSNSGNKITITGPTVPAATAAASITAGSGGGGATIKANAGNAVSIVGGNNVTVSGASNKVSVSAGTPLDIRVSNTAPTTNLVNNQTFWADPQNHKLALRYNGDWINFTNP